MTRTMLDGVLQPDPVSDGGGSLTTDGTYDERYGGGKSAIAQALSVAGDTVLINPAPGNLVRVYWVSAIPNPDNSSANLVQFRFGSNPPFYASYALSHWEMFDGGVDEDLIVNLQNGQPVALTIHYREITP